MNQPLRTCVARAALALTVLAFTGAARADWQVIDNTAIDKLSDILRSIGSRSGDGGGNTSLNDTTSNLLKEIRTQVRRVSFSTSLPNSNLQQIGDISGYVQTACGARAANGGQRVASLPTINPANPGAAMQQVCQQLIQLRAQSFNDSVDMVNRFQEYGRQLDAIAQSRDSARNQGDLWANTNEALRTIGMLQAEMGFWQTRVASYDSAIRYLEGQQNAITQATVKGPRGGAYVGQFVQTRALAAALAIP